MQWLIIPFLIGGIVFLLLLSSERRYKQLLSSRDPISDEELVRLYFHTGDISPEIPGAVREIFAEHMGYPHDPDDTNSDDDEGAKTSAGGSCGVDLAAKVKICLPKANTM